MYNTDISTWTPNIFFWKAHNHWVLAIHFKEYMRLGYLHQVVACIIDLYNVIQMGVYDEKCLGYHFSLVISFWPRIFPRFLPGLFGKNWSWFNRMWGIKQNAGWTDRLVFFFREKSNPTTPRGSPPWIFTRLDVAYRKWKKTSLSVLVALDNIERICNHIQCILTSNSDLFRHLECNLDSVF